MQNGLNETEMVELHRLRMLDGRRGPIGFKNEGRPLNNSERIEKTRLENIIRYSKTLPDRV